MRITDQLYSRREFLRSGLYLTAAASTVPSFLARTCLAIDQPTGLQSVPGRPDDRILVVVQLSGGNDGLNTIVPYGHPAYAKNRPTLALRGSSIIRLDDELAVHRSLAAVQRIYDDGEFAWIQGVGYPNPNRSHFRSMEIWHTGSDAGEQVQSGWIGRYFDHTCSGEQPPEPTAAVTIGREMPQAMRSKTGHPAGIVLDRPEQYAWQSSGRTTTQQNRQRELMSMLNRITGATGTSIDYLQRTALDALDSAELIARADRRYRANVEYPNNRFGHDLQLIAKLIAGKVGGRIFYASIGGFDTHAGQAGMHASLLQTLSDGLYAFRRDLVRLRQWERVAVLGFSEFGRRVDENGSQGTDHGAAGPMFLMGPQVRAGLHGAHPSLDDLGNSDLKFNIDFRSVYGSVIDQWLGTAHVPILGREFPRLNLIET